MLSLKELAVHILIVFFFFKTEDHLSLMLTCIKMESVTETPLQSLIFTLKPIQSHETQ